jgi:hypothetical protein
MDPRSILLDSTATEIPSIAATRHGQAAVAPLDHYEIIRVRLPPYHRLCLSQRRD